MSLWEKLRGKLGSEKPTGQRPPAPCSASASTPGATVLRPAAAAAGAALTAAAPSLDADADADNKIAGTFPVKRILGSGGMGTVYLVQHPSWNTEVALKVPKAELIADAENRHRITVEAEAWTELGLHPHIAYCYYVQVLNGVLLMVVEYVDGGNLAEWIAKHGQSAELKTKLDLAIQFCHALEHAHGKGLIHRDIKPSNVLLTKEGQLKLTDFGIARVGTNQAGGRAPISDAAVDGTRVGIGTEDYMAPEQWASAQVDARGDLFSFGVCLYELFCGRRPFHGRAIGEPQEPLDPSKLAPNLPTQLCELLRQCVRWQRDRRPEHAQEIRRRLCGAYEAQFNAPNDYFEIPPYTESAAVLNNRALSYIELGQPELAENAWQAALQADAKHIEAIYNHGLHEWRSARLADDALIDRLELAAADASEPWLAAYLKAQVYLESGDVGSAKRCADGVDRGKREPTQLAQVRSAIGSLLCECAAVKTLVDELDLDAEADPDDDGEQWGASSLCLSADGQRALRGTHDGLELWDVGGKRLVRRLSGHVGWDDSVCMSADGRFALSGSQDKTVKVWDLESGDCLRTLSGHTAAVVAVRLSADGHLGISGSEDRTLKVWALANGRCNATLTGHTDEVTSVAMTIDGRIAVSGSRDGTLKVWDIGSAKCVRTIEHDSWVDSVCLSSDGSRALSGCFDGMAKLWDLATGECLATCRGHTDSVTSVCLCASDRLAVSAGDDARIRVWDVATGRCLRTVTESTDEPLLVCASGDGRNVMWAGWNVSVKHWSPPGWQHHAPWCPGSVGLSSALIGSSRIFLQAVATAKESLACDNRSEAVALLKTARVGAFRRHPAGAEAWADLYLRCRRVCLIDSWSQRVATDNSRDLCVTEDGRHALSGALDLWDLSSGRRVRSYRKTVGEASSVCLSADGRFFVSDSQDNSLRFFDAVSEEFLCACSGHTKLVSSIHVGQDGRHVLSGSHDCTVRLWDLATGHCIRKLARHTKRVNSVCMSGDGRHALSGSDDKTVRHWDLLTGQCLQTLSGHDSSVTCVAFSFDGRSALSASVDETLRLWDLASGRCLRTLAGHTHCVQSACLTVDGRHALSGSDDTTLKLWDLADGRCLHTFEGHTAGVRSVSLSKDDRIAVSGGVDGLRIWTLDWELEVRDPADWVDEARPYLEVFLKVQRPYGPALPPDRAPSDKEIASRLKRKRSAAWTEGDFQRLLYTLGCAGYGWLRPDGVRRELDRMAKAMASGTTT